MAYGISIGKKFHEDGSVRYFPGNTVVAPIRPGNPAYDVMVQLRQMVVDAGLEQNIILLPEDSYHMTVLDCLVFEERTPDHWPAGLAQDASMAEADDYISAAVATAPNPGRVRMRFDRLRVGKSAVVALLVPDSPQDEKKLWDFRNGATDAMGMRVPNYSKYRFHISLGYLWQLPEGEAAQKMDALVEKIDALLAKQPPFETGVPYMAYFADMMAFSPDRLQR